jgi:multiple sugar transport system substrate-binding protein
MSRAQWMAFGAAAAVLAAGFLCGCRPHEEVVTIRYMAWGNPDQLATERKLIASFERRNPDVRVKLTMVPHSAYHHKLIIMLASHTGPDVARVDQYYFPSLVRDGHFECLDPFIRRDRMRLDDFFPQALDECRYQGRLYAFNVLFGGRVIYYNKTMFQRAGLPDPYQQAIAGAWTTEAYRRAACALTTKKGDAYVQFGTELPWIWDLIWTFGGDVLDPQMERCEIDGPGGRAALQFMHDLRFRWHVAPSPAEASMAAFTFESGRLGMIFGWAGESPRYRANIKGFEWDIAPPPTGPGGRVTPVKGNQLVMYSESKHKDKAWRLIKFMTSPEAEMLLCGRLRRAIPTRRSVARDAEYLEPVDDQGRRAPPYHVHVFTDVLDYAHRMPIDWKWYDWRPAMDAQIELLSIGELPVEDAPGRICRVIDRGIRQAHEW